MNVPRLGIGLTLFTRDSNGLAVRVDPDRVFRKGDRVRILLETNTDGYLYIFNKTNDSVPVMIYPDAEIDEGGNYLQAHVPFEIPAADAPDERLRWFAFDENTGTEKLNDVVIKDKLPEGVTYMNGTTRFIDSQNPDRVKAAQEKLTAASHKLAQAMYGQGQPGPGAPGFDPGAAPGGRPCGAARSRRAAPAARSRRCGIGTAGRRGSTG